MQDLIKSENARQEIKPNGTPVFEKHHTEAALVKGLATWFRVEGDPVATVDSSGPNRSSDHKTAKKGMALVPLAARVTVTGGDGLLQIDGKEVAHAESEVQVPDVQQPRQSDVLEVTQSFFRVNGKAVARGQN